MLFELTHARQPQLDQRLCAAGRHLGLIVFVHANGSAGVRCPAHSSGTCGHCVCVLVAAAALAGSEPRTQTALAARFCCRVAELRHSFCLLLVRPAVHQHGVVLHPERHGASVWGIGGMDLAQGPTQCAADHGAGRRFRRRRHAGIGQSQFQARCIGHGIGLGCGGLSGSHAVLRHRGQLQTNQPDADLLDLLCHVAFNAPLLTRRQRAEKLRRDKSDFFDQYSDEARQILNELLDRYTENGTDQLRLPDALRIAPISNHGNAMEIAAKFGGPEQLRMAVTQMQATLYP